MNLGLIGSIFLAACGAPEAWRSYRTKSCGLGWPMLSMWLIGEVFVIIYAFQKREYVLLVNYFFNLAFLAIMMRYKC